MQIAKTSIYFYPFTLAGQNNCNTIVIDGPEKVIIDPGHRHLWPRLERKILEDGLNPSSFSMALYTHSHPDHMEAGFLLEENFGLCQAMSAAEKEFFDKEGPGFFRWMGLDPPPDFVGRLLDEGPLPLGDMALNLYLTPGHSPGSLCLHFPEERILVTGDLLFARSYGRTDFPGGDQDALARSIRRMEGLENVETILPGHGPAIVGEANVAANYKYLSHVL
jgi:glyoxylase-like metal-dependent hydrolase (beta-lactamase superfamily II)